MSEKKFLGYSGMEWGLGAVVALVVVNVLKRVTDVGKKATDAAATDIANAYVAVTNWLYGSYTVVPTGNVILPNGAKVPLAKVHVTFDDADNVGRFTYQGTNYIIAPNPSGGPAYDTNGDYHAQ